MRRCGDDTDASRPDTVQDTIGIRFVAAAAGISSWEKVHSMNGGAMGFLDV